MSVKFGNFGRSTLAVPIAPGDLAFTVAAGQGALFPATPTASDYFMIVVVNTSAQREVMKCTNRTVDAFTVVRAQEGSVAMAFAAGDLVGHRWTAGSVDLIRAEAKAFAVAMAVAL